jgi:RNA polymerase sigma factor (sigma-70 family)
VYKKEDGFASLKFGVPESGQSQMFEAIVDSPKFYRRLLSGKKKAFEFLWKQGIENVVPLLRSLDVHDSEDVWQDTWIDLKLTRCSGYEPRRGKLSKWILVYSTSRARDRQRKRLRERTKSIGDLSDIDKLSEIDKISVLAWKEADAEENKSGDQEKKQLLKRALRALEADERKILWLRYGQGQKSTAIAKSSGTSTTAIRQQISRARRRLKEEIERLRKNELRRSIKKPGRADSSRPGKRRQPPTATRIGL